MKACEKCAIVMITLGDSSAAEVFKHMDSAELTKVSEAMVKMKSYTREQLAQVMQEFHRDIVDCSELRINTNDYLRRVLILSMGEARASSLLEDLMEGTQRSNKEGIEALNQLEPQAVFSLICSEHPQIIATILVHLQRHQSAEVLALFDEKTRNDIMLRIATFGGVQPEALQALTEVLNSLLHGRPMKRSKMGGIRPAAEILNLLKTPQEDAALAAVREFDNELAQKIIDEMFLFESLVELDDRCIQRILQDIDADSLIIALKGAGQTLRDKFFRNMSRRQSELMTEDLLSRGPVRLSQVEAEQKNILMIVRKLSESKEIQLAAREDIYV